MTPTQGHELINMLERLAKALETANEMTAVRMGNTMHDPECWRSGCSNSDHAAEY